MPQTKTLAAVRQGMGAHTAMDPEKIARDLAPRFAERAAAYDRDAAFPVDDVKDLRESGLLGLLVPRRLGGMGAEFADYVRCATALARGSGARRSSSTCTRP